MNRDKTYVWILFDNSESHHDYQDYTTNWGSLVAADHIIVKDDLRGWQGLMRSQHHPLTLYILGHGIAGNSDIVSHDSSVRRTSDWVYDRLCTNLAYGACLHKGVIEKIKFFQCHGGLENGPAHAFKQHLRGAKAEIRVFGYNLPVYTPNSADYSGHKMAGTGTPTVRASTERFEVQHNYGDVAVNMSTIILAADDQQEKGGWTCC